MRNLYHDIETLPGTSPVVEQIISDSIEKDIAELTPPSNYSKPESVAKWMEEKKAELAQSFSPRWLKTSLDGGLGEIFCISWAVDGGDIRSVSRGATRAIPESDRPIPELTSEKSMLEEFFRQLATEGDGFRWVGHNTKDFDLRFLFQRCVVNGVEPPVYIPHDIRYNGKEVFDTMMAWAGWGNRIRLDRLCLLLGVAQKGEMDGESDINGANLFEALLDGRGDEAVRYCEADVERVRQIHWKMTFGGK